MTRLSGRRIAQRLSALLPDTVLAHVSWPRRPALATATGLAPNRRDLGPNAALTPRRRCWQSAVRQAATAAPWQEAADGAHSAGRRLRDWHRCAPLREGLLSARRCRQAAHRHVTAVVQRSCRVAVVAAGAPVTCACKRGTRGTGTAHPPRPACACWPPRSYHAPAASEWPAVTHTAKNH